MPVSRKDIAEFIAGNHAISKTSADEIIKDVFAFVTDTVAAGEVVSVADFGKFSPKKTAARTGRNPSTGAAIEIAASTKLAFKPAKVAADKVNGGA